MATIGDTLLDGKVTVISVDPNGLILSIEFTILPADELGKHPGITFSAGQSVAVVSNTAQAFLAALGL